MQKLIIVAVLVGVFVGMVGCGPKDSHQIYTERVRRHTAQADWRSLIDDVNTNLLMDERPSHLSFFIQR